MRSVLRATAILSSSSIVSMIVGVVSAKAWALLLGPAGLGEMGLIQGLLGLATLAGAMGIGNALVREGAHALGAGEKDRAAALQTASWVAAGAFGGAASLLLILLRVPIARLMLGTASEADSVVLVALALLPSQAGTILTSILNAHHRVGSLAKVAIANSLLAAGTTILLVWRWRVHGIAPAVLVSALVTCGSCWLFLRRAGYRTAARVPLAEVWPAARSLVRFGAPYTVSMLVGTGMQWVLPSVVLHTLGRENVGYYRAAMAIAVTYLGFLVTAMGQDYYPRVSAARDRPEALVDLVNQQHRLVLLTAVPIILAALALAPVILTLIYSPKFVPAADVLEWQLIGDIFKFAAWAMSFVVLARCGSLTFFFTELTGGATLLGASWLCMRWYGLSGLGIGFLVVGVVYYLLMWAILRHSIGLRWTAENGRMLVVAAVAAGGIHFARLAGPAAFRLAAPLALVAILGLVNIRTLIREYRGHPLRPSEPSVA